MAGVLVRILQAGVVVDQTLAAVPPAGGAFSVVFNATGAAPRGPYSVDARALLSDGSAGGIPGGSNFSLDDPTTGAGPVHSSFEIAPARAPTPFSAPADLGPASVYTYSRSLNVLLFGNAGIAAPAGGGVVEYRAANVDPRTGAILGSPTSFTSLPFTPLPNAGGNPQAFAIDWTLHGAGNGSDDGPRAVDLQFRTSTGLLSAIYRRGILLDASPPIITLRTPRPGSFATSNAVLVSGLLTDATEVASFQGVPSAVVALERQAAPGRFTAVDQAPLQVGPGGWDSHVG
jgi:hypothetical protein